MVICLQRGRALYMGDLDEQIKNSREDPLSSEIVKNKLLKTGRNIYNMTRCCQITSDRIKKTLWRV